MWSYEVQWLFAFIPGVQDPLSSVETLVLNPVSNPLCLSGLAPSSRSEGFFVLPILHLFWKKSLSVPPHLIAIKDTLQSLLNLFRILQDWKSSCLGVAPVFHSFLYKFPLLVMVSSFRNLENSHWWATFPSHSLCFYAFLFLNSTFDFKGFSGGTRSKLYTYSINKNFHC